MSDKQKEMEELERFLNALDRLNTLHILHQRGEVKLHKSAVEILDQLPDSIASTTATLAIIEHVNKLNVRTGPKARKTYFIDTPQFTVALRYVEGSTSYDDAIAELVGLCSCEKRTAEKHLSDMKPRAERTLAGLKSLASYRTK